VEGGAPVEDGAGRRVKNFHEAVDEQMRLRTRVIVLPKLELVVDIEVQKAFDGDDVLHLIVKHLAGEGFVLKREDQASVDQEQHREHRNVINREPGT
jgi:hypothetical protein